MVMYKYVTLFFMNKDGYEFDDGNFRKQTTYEHILSKFDIEKYN
jgi:hypothetical protein